MYVHSIHGSELLSIITVKGGMRYFTETPKDEISKLFEKYQSFFDNQTRLKKFVQFVVIDIYSWFERKQRLLCYICSVK